GSDEPAIEVYMSDVRIAEPPGHYPIVIETDSRGWLHLLVAEAGAGWTRLAYHRQTRVAGELRWIADTITEMGIEPEWVHVDMELGPDRRPHIVYWDPTMGAIRYAT